MKQISTYSKINAHLLAHTHISRMALYAAFLFIGVVLSTGSAWAEEIYNETFGSNTTASTKAFSDKTDFSDSHTWGYMTATSWNQGRNSVTPSDTEDNTYTGASGSGYAQSSTADGTLILTFGDLSDYTDVVLSFGYRNGASKSGARSFTTHVSGDGGETWTEIDCDKSRTTQTWKKITYEVPAAKLVDFAVKFTATAGNQSAVDDVILSGTIPSCEDYAFFYGTTKGSEDHSECFSFVTGSTDTWLTDLWTIPSADQWTYVGEPAWNASPGKSANLQLSNMPYALNHANNLGTIGTNVMEGAQGYVKICSNSTDANRYVGFIPAGYVLRWGTDGEGWNSIAFTGKTAAIEEEDWYTPIQTWTSSNADDYTYVGLKTSSGYVWANRSEARRPVFLKPTSAWDHSSANFAIYYFDASSHTGWSAIMTDPDGDGIYEAWIPNNYAYTTVNFVRLNATGSTGWDNKWNQTGNITLPSDKNVFTITGGSGDAYTGEWSLYDKKGKFHISANSNTNNWYCHFLPHHVLHFDANGGEGAPADQTIAIDASPCQLTVSATEPTRTGYTFLGWNESSSAASKDDEWDGGDTHAMTGDVTLYAVWSANTIEITLDKNNSDASGSTSGSTSIKYDATAVLSSPTHASRTGYTLEGYYAEVGCTNKVMTNAGVLVNYSGYVESGKWVRVTSPTTLYAKWTPNNTSITLDTQSATTDGTTSVTATFDASTNLTSAITKPTKTGYMFGGYFTAKDGGDTQLIGTDGNWIANVTDYTGAGKIWKYVGSTLTLYAYWIPVKVFVPVTSSTSLADGDEIIFYGSDNFMSTTQNDNNRGVTTSDFTASDGNYIVATSGSVQRAILEATGTTGKWLFKVGENAYLYAASNSNNHLKTGDLTTVGDNGVWTISVDGSNNATITAQGSNSRKLMKYNSSKLFSCYDPVATVSGTSLPKLYYYHCTDPYIRIFPSSFETFTYAAGYGPSVPQALHIKGYNLTGNLTVACPSGYELSSTSAASGFGTSNLTLTKDANDKVNTTIYIRLAAGKSAGSYNQTLTISGGGITSTDVSLSGSVVAAPSGTAYTLVTNEADIFPGDEIVIMNSSSDRLLSNKQATNNRIAATPNGGVNFEVLGSTVFTKTADPDSIQNIVVEGCDDEWLFKVGDDSYLYSAGANNYNYLRSNTLESVGTDGRWKIQVNANLADTIRSIGSASRNTMWYNKTNNIFSSYATTQTEIPRIYAKSSAIANVCGSPSALSGFETTYGTASTAQTISVKARNISTGNVTVAAPSGYEVCLTENGTYTSSVTITPSDGVVSATTVYVRLTASSNMGTYNSNLTISATGATTRNVALSGEITCGDPGLAFAGDVNEDGELEMSLSGSSVTSDKVVFSSLSSGAYTVSVLDVYEDPTTDLTLNTTTKKFTATAVGIYTVTLSQAASGNYCAGDEIEFTVEVSCGTPVAPTGLEVSDIDYNEATISWNAVEGADHYDVLVTGKSSGGDEDYSELYDNLISTSVTATGLKGGCTYEYYVTVTNTCDETADSGVDDFTTIYSVTYHSATEDDYVIGVTSGGSVDARGTDDCDNGKIFVGWTTSAVDALQQSDPTTNETGAIASVTANTDLYAVFAAQNGYTTTTILDEKWNVVEWDGTNKIVGGAYSSWATNFDAAPNTSFKISETTYQAIVFDVSSARTITSESAYSNLKEIQITGSNRSSFAMNVTVKVSTDKSDWTTVDTKSLGTASNSSPQILVFALETKGNYYVRIETQAKSSGNKTGITNIRLYQGQDYYLTDYSTNCTLASSPAAITWENGSGTLADGTQPSSATIGSDITMPTLTKANYRFDGWKATLSEATKSDVFTGGDKYTVNHPVTFTAQWTQVFSVSDPTLGLTSCKDVKVTSTTQTFTTLGMHNAVPSVTLADGTYFTMTINSHEANSDDEDYSYTFTYQPNAYGTGSGAATNTTTATITDARTGVVSSPITLRGRSLPDEFVIAVKKGDQWYALPNTLAGTEGAQGPITPIAIPVDNATTPTKSTNPNAETIYGATGRYTNTNVNGIRFTNDGSHYIQISTTSDNYKMWLSSTGGKNVQDWYLKSSDFGAYEVFMDPIGSPDETRRIELYTSSGIKMGHHGTRGTANIYILPIEYTVTYDDNGATSGEVPTDDTKYKYNATVTVLAKPGSLEKTGHTFLSWNTQADGNGTDYAADATFNITAGVTLYAKWQNNAYEGKYTFHYGDNSTGTWTVVPFSQVGETDEWTISNFTIPNPDDYPNFYVGYEGWYVNPLSTSSKSDYAVWDDMILLPGTGTVGAATGAIGKLVIMDDSSEDNLNVGFLPDGYGVTLSGSDQTLEFKNTATADYTYAPSSNYLWETDPVTLVAADVSGTFTVKLKTSSGYVTCAISADENAATVDGRKVSGTADMASGAKGRFQIWSNSTTNNFALRFIPMTNWTLKRGDWGGRFMPDGKWSLGREPNIDDEVIIYHDTDVDYQNNAQAKSVKIDKSEDSRKDICLTITDWHAALLVKESITAKHVGDADFGATNQYDLRIKTGILGNGCLIVGGASTTTAASYDFYSSAYKVRYYYEGKYYNFYTNQYIGIPFASMDAYQMYGMNIYEYNDDEDKWAAPESSTLKPWTAYDIICKYANDFSMHYLNGTLNLPGIEGDGRKVELTCGSRYNADGTFDGEHQATPEANGDHMFANSWTAPIDISKLDDDDVSDLDEDGNPDIEKTIYIFNAGYVNTWEPKKVLGDLAGQWSSYPFQASAHLDSAVISCMQAFLITSKVANAKLTLDYKKHVYDPAIANGAINTLHTRAPRRERADDDPVKLKIVLHTDSTIADKLYIFERGDFSTDLDNGWDGRKIMGIVNVPQLYAISGNTNLAVAAIPDMEGTVVGFQKGSEYNHFSFTFEYNGTDTWYLHDTKTMTSTSISNTSTYEFYAEDGDTEGRFIISAYPISQTTTGVDEVNGGGSQDIGTYKFIKDDKLFIYRNGTLYDATGKLVK